MNIFFCFPYVLMPLLPTLFNYEKPQPAMNANLVVQSSIHYVIHNACYNSAHSLIGKTYLTIVSSDIRLLNKSHGDIQQ